MLLKCDMSIQIFMVPEPYVVSQPKLPEIESF